MVIFVFEQQGNLLFICWHPNCCVEDSAVQYIHVVGVFIDPGSAYGGLLFMIGDLLDF